MNRIELEISIEASVEQIWSAWMSSGSVSQWLAPMANVEPKVGGAFELFFSPPDTEHMSTIGCSFLELSPSESLSFNWKGPDNFAEFMNQEPLTMVKVIFEEEGTSVKIKLIHSGWGTGEAWDAAREWHRLAWSQVLNSLKEYAENGSSR